MLPLLLVLAGLTGCAPAYRFPGPLDGLGSAPVRLPPRASKPAPERPPPDDAPVRGGSRRQEAVAQDVVEAAAGFLGKSVFMVGDTRYRHDCSGLVEAAYGAAGVRLAGSSASLFEQARDLGVLHRHRTPHPGDVAFFDDTWDRNGNGKLDDTLTHVALVESVDRSGTISIVHYTTRGVVRERMNLREPDLHRDESGDILNHYLRRRSSKDSPRTRYLTAQLWAGFASFWKVEELQVALLDSP